MHKYSRIQGIAAFLVGAVIAAVLFVYIMVGHFSQEAAGLDVSGHPEVINTMIVDYQNNHPQN